MLMEVIFMAKDLTDFFFLIFTAAHRDEDDSDMMMEADELPPPEYSVVRSESRVVRQYSSTPQQSDGDFHSNIDASVSRVEHFKPEIVISSSSSDPLNPSPAEQNFFPSFFAGAPLSGHARPYKIPNTLAASIAGRYSAGRANSFDHTILGSGDFAVVRGGTFYPEEEDNDDQRYQVKSDEFFDPYFSGGHGKPIAEPLVAKKDLFYPDDPFENFKDFADINVGSDGQFSHFVVIYENKNSTKPHPSHPSPKNIFEQLQMLDQEKEREESEKKLMKLSKYKTKLAKTKIVKKYKKKLGPKTEQSQDYTDPLLATS